jgi:prephenate dehydrogenase
MLVMDVGSTKRDVVDAARRVLKDRIVSFVPAHPIAGKEGLGIGHADASLYQGRQVILTPLPRPRPSWSRRRPTRGRRSARTSCACRRGPRRGVRGGEPPAAHPRLRLFQLGLAPAGGRDYLSLGGPAFATSRASPRAIRRSGATS